jgi:Fur family ferric uptake transcriptional regulator
MPNPVRRTRQREAILAAFDDLPGHPTAEEIHAAVRAALPRISLGTVYRNLEIFVQEGRLRRIAVYGGPARFDCNASPHGHIQCVRCGRVRDVPQSPSPPGALRGARLGGFTILETRHHWLGLCAPCRREERAPSRTGR